MTNYYDYNIKALLLIIQVGHDILILWRIE